MQLVVHAPPHPESNWQTYWAEQFIASCAIGGGTPPPELQKVKCANCKQMVAREMDHIDGKIDENARYTCVATMPGPADEKPTEPRQTVTP